MAAVRIIAPATFVDYPHWLAGSRVIDRNGSYSGLVALQRGSALCPICSNKKRDENKNRGQKNARETGESCSGKCALEQQKKKGAENGKRSVDSVQCGIRLCMRCNNGTHSTAIAGGYVRAISGPHRNEKNESKLGTRSLREMFCMRFIYGSRESHVYAKIHGILAELVSAVCRCRYCSAVSLINC